MSEFSLTTLFVVPVGNVLPVAGGPENLTAGKFGVFKDDARTIATAGNVGTAKYVQFFQGQEASIAAQLGSKRSDRIKASKVTKWYKVTGSATALPEIVTTNNFTAKCGEDFTYTFRAHSNYIDTIAFNGFTRSVTVKTPCCACGEDPCDVVDAEALVDLILAKIAQEDAVQTSPTALKASTFFTFTKTGVGAAAALVQTSKTLTAYGQPCDLAVNPFEYDRVWSNVFAYRGPATTSDFIVSSSCESSATVTYTQSSTYPRGISSEVKQAEIDLYSYQSPNKHLFRTSGYNPYFESYVTDGQIYDMYVVQFDEMTENQNWNMHGKMDERDIIYVPQGATATIEAILTAYLGAPTDAT